MTSQVRLLSRSLSQKPFFVRDKLLLLSAEHHIVNGRLESAAIAVNASAEQSGTSCQEVKSAACLRAALTRLNLLANLCQDIRDPR